MSYERNIINFSPIDTFQSQLYFDFGVSLHHEQDTITGTTSPLIHEHGIDAQTKSSTIDEQEIRIKSSTSSDTYVESKVLDYFTKPYGPSESRKTKCSICKIEFSYPGLPSSLKYHLMNKHKIGMLTNLSQVDRQSQQISTAENDHTDSQYRVGECFYEGYGTKKDILTAIYWLNKAKENGSIDANELLKEMISNINIKDNRTYFYF
ncbi:6195_t:CDS:2 [Diversispora eburnea]|uniref:6195_t:CDS:1 n=1 Tax=Diversispora eburnea TaxID=1213867 RepID=A0A9N9C826_9GLOM|nr:6195_t:CDS:2 [Diversispora eburnea]